MLMITIASFNQTRGDNGQFFSLIFFLLLPLALGILTIYLSIDLFEYLKNTIRLPTRKCSLIAFLACPVTICFTWSNHRNIFDF